MQDAADAEERAEKAESLADAAQERMSLKEEHHHRSTTRTRIPDKDEDADD